MPWPTKNGYTRAEEAVNSGAEFGLWKVLRLDSLNDQRVIALCRGCDTEHSLSIYDLRRDRRANKERPKGCSPCALKIKDGKFERLPQSEAPLRQRFRTCRKNAVAGGKEFTLSLDEFKVLSLSRCDYCDCAPAQLAKTRVDFILINGLDRVNNEQGYTLENVVPCCKMCNYMKHMFDRDEFLSQVEKIYLHRGPGFTH